MKRKDDTDAFDEQVNDCRALPLTLVPSHTVIIIMQFNVGPTASFSY